MHRFQPALWVALTLGSVLLACSGDGGAGGDDDGKGGSNGNHGADAKVPDFGNAKPMPDAGPVAMIDAAVHDNLALLPDNASLAIKGDEPIPTLHYQVRTATGDPVQAAIFRVEDGGFGHIDADGLFTPSGTRGGITYIEARVGSTVLRTQLTIEITWTQNGAVDDSGGGLQGGHGGVGGEGPGGAVSDAVKTALDDKPKKDDAFKWLYPYDQTVFPLGMLAPLLMWSPGNAAVADGIAIELTGDHFDYRGYFGRPEPLADDAPFVRHPIPQAVWETATNTVAGGSLKVSITLAKDGVAYGPFVEHFIIARGQLKGTVYYQSYGTNLAKNYHGAIGAPDGMFGGATLAIKPGAMAPELVAGGNGGEAECRVCHSVSSDGSRMLVQHGDDYAMTSSYDLRDAYQETAYDAALRSQLAWTGMTPNGALALANGEPIDVYGDPVSQLYDLETGDVVPSTGLMEFVREAAFPAFAHDGRRVAFNFWNGPGNAAIGAGDGKKLVAMDFDPMTNMFGNPQLLYQEELRPGWPSFSPSANSLVFAVEIDQGRDQKLFHTRYGGKGELWWANFDTGKAHRLDRANGIADGNPYLPRGPEQHDKDEVLNYEPTVAPIASGGFAWMVFTSRRLYGNVATIDPWFSDPREHDLTQTPTTKKLWVAAIDLDVKTEEFDVLVGEDPSHPAFYLPGQELLAGNTRGFWTVDPCKADGKSCSSGVDCCSGYCQEDDKGELTCGRKTDECVQEFERCDTAADCCDGDNECVNHICTVLGVD